MSDVIDDTLIHSPIHEEEFLKIEFSQRDLRIAIGFLSISFPFLLFAGGAIFFDLPLLESLSHYYHTPMRDVFVGVLFAVGIMFFAYKGYDRLDGILADIAFVSTLGIALFPTSHTFPNVEPVSDIFSLIHSIFAFIFFSVLAFFSLCLFTKTHPETTPTPEKLLRNRIHRISGIVIIASLLNLGLLLALPSSLREIIDPFNPIFWLETVATTAFGISWWVKGGLILQDKT